MRPHSPAGIVAGCVGFAALAYLAYALLFSTLAHLRQPKVCGRFKARFRPQSLYGGAGNGPDRISLIESTADAFGVRVMLVRGARQTLDIAYHAIAKGVTTEALTWELWQAAERGVRVRLLVDDKLGLAGAEANRAVRLLCSHPRVAFRVYNPAKPLRPWAWHSLLHDKFIIADGTWLLLGGRNLGDRYFAPIGYDGEVTLDRDVLVWNTTGRGAGSVLEDAEAYMSRLWELPCTQTPRRFAGLEKAGQAELRPYRVMAKLLAETNAYYYKKTLEQYLAATVPTKKVSLIHNPVNLGRKYPWVGYQLQQLALGASRRVLVQTPYATAHPKLLDTLWRTGVNAEVTMVTNSLASSPNLAAYSNYITQRGKFLATGANIYEYQSPHSIHGKSLVIDDRLSAVGSFNLDDRSMYIDTETMLVADSAPFAAMLTGAVRAHQSQSLLVGIGNRPVPNAKVPALPVTPQKKLGVAIASLISRPLRFLI